ncbi:MAG: hypothetical protein WC965_01675 [Thiohalomonadaceae bacterium]
MLETLPPGFTLNLDKFYINPKGTLPLVDSTYDLGLIFGAFVEGGVHHMSSSGGKTSIGSVRWYIPEKEFEFGKTLVEAIKSTTGLDAAYRYHVPRNRNRFIVICYNNALSRFFEEFGQGKEKHIPEKYLVNNQNYLRGIYDGSTSVMSQTRDKPLVDALLEDIKVYLGIDTKFH